MMRLKKKKEEEAKAAAEEAARAEAAAANATTSDGKEAAEPGSAAEPAAAPSTGFSLTGVGGQQLGGGTSKKKKRTPGEIRIQTDMAELDGGDVAKIHFPSKSDLTRFNVEVTPDSGFWTGATYHFTFTVPPAYPHEAPKVVCNTKIYHPNIDLQGAVCLNILREDWKPVLDINAVIYGLIYLFYDPNPGDPLNHEAADLFRNNPAQFERTVKRTLQGGSVQGVHFERLV